MKIGIMSMQRITNYGSYLQAYALKKIVENLGHEVIFIDYKIEDIILEKKEPVVEKKSKIYLFLRKIKWGMIDIIHLLFGVERKKKIEQRKKLTTNYSKYLLQLGITDKRTEQVKVDILIIGSDEVFNCLQDNPDVGYSKELFGENVNARKVISYAASAGYTTLDGLAKYGIYDEVSHMLKNNFSFISVRDENTFFLVEELVGKKPYMHLDPVLISNFDLEIIEKRDIANYIVVYSYEGRMTNEIEIRKIKDFAKENNLKTVSLGNFQYWTDIKLEATPFELLGYIKNAKYVITDTFHGTIFSIILHKQFGTIIRDSNEEKLRYLLKKFDLLNHEIVSNSDLNKILNLTINYKRLDDIRKEEKKSSIDYLKHALKEG